MNTEDRRSETKKNLEKIMNNQGTIYALGVMMGMLARLSENDYLLYREIEIRAERSSQDRDKAPL